MDQRKELRAAFAEAEKRLTEKPDATWWIVVEGPDQKIREVGFVRPPQEARARDTYASLSKAHVLEAFLEGKDS